MGHTVPRQKKNFHTVCCEAIICGFKGVVAGVNCTCAPAQLAGITAGMSPSLARHRLDDSSISMSTARFLPTFNETLAGVFGWWELLDAKLNEARAGATPPDNRASCRCAVWCSSHMIYIVARLISHCYCPCDPSIARLVCTQGTPL